MEEGYALLQLHPKTTLRLWGKVRKRGTPFPKSVTPRSTSDWGSLPVLPP